MSIVFSLTRLSLSLAGFPKTILTTHSLRYAVHTPTCTHVGLGSFHFARRYFRNHGCFLFLSLLRCFSSGGSPRTPMDSVHGTGFLSRWVAPFRHPRIIRYLLLPAAFRSLSRLSSAPSAKASALCSSSLDLLPHMLAYICGSVAFRRLRLPAFVSCCVTLR